MKPNFKAFQYSKNHTISLDMMKLPVVDVATAKSKFSPTQNNASRDHVYFPLISLTGACLFFMQS